MPATARIAYALSGHLGRWAELRAKDAAHALHLVAFFFARDTVQATDGEGEDGEPSQTFR